MPNGKVGDAPQKTTDQLATSQTSASNTSTTDATAESLASAVLSSGPNRSVRTEAQKPAPIDVSDMRQPVPPTTAALKREAPPLQLLKPKKESPTVLKAFKQGLPVHYGIEISSSLNKKIARKLESQTSPSDSTGVIDIKTGVSKQFLIDYSRQTTNIETANGNFKSLTRYSLPAGGTTHEISQEDINDEDKERLLDAALLDETVRLITDLVGDKRAVAPLTCIANQTSNASIMESLAELTPASERLLFAEPQAAYINVYSFAKAKNGNIEFKNAYYSKITHVVLPPEGDASGVMVTNQSRVRTNTADENFYDHAIVLSAELDKKLLMQGRLKIVNCHTKREVFLSPDLEN